MFGRALLVHTRSNMAEAEEEARLAAFGSERGDGFALVDDGLPLVGFDASEAALGLDSARGGGSPIPGGAYGMLAAGPGALTPFNSAVGFEALTADGKSGFSDAKTAAALEADAETADVAACSGKLKVDRRTPTPTTSGRRVVEKPTAGTFLLPSFACLARAGSSALATYAGSMSRRN